MINILLITAHFTPENSAGANRPVSLYRHLNKVDITTTVIAKKYTKNLANRDNVYYLESDINWRESNTIYLTFLQRLIQYVIARFFSAYTDKKWINAIILHSEQIINTHKISHIYATFPSVEALKAGWILSQKYNIPLILEFRDGLVFETILRNMTWFKRRQIIRFEKKIVASCKAVITIGHNLSNYFKKTYSNTKVYTVYNGYEEDDFPKSNEIELQDNQMPKLIYHFGNLSSSRKANRSALFEALSFLKNNDEIKKSNYKFVFIGNFSKEEIELCALNKIDDIVVFKNYMPKKEGIKEIMTHGSGLLFYGVKDEKSIVSTKLLEYVRMNIPILGICEGNEAANIIRDTGTGLVCEFDKESIIDMFRLFINGQFEFKPNLMKIELFNRKNQAKQIADIITKIDF